MKLGYVFGLLCMVTTAAVACDGCIPEPVIRYTNRAYTAVRNPKKDVTLTLDSIMLSAIVPDKSYRRADNNNSNVNLAKALGIRRFLYPADFVPTTPEDVYGVMLQECARKYGDDNASVKRVKIRNPYDYCRCLANAARTNSYAYSTITTAAYSNIREHHYTQCDTFFDPIYTMPEIYSNVYWLCKAETNHTAECDNLALDVRASVIARLDEIRPNDDTYVMYDSEYQKLIHHPDFNNILDELSELCVTNGY